MDNHHIPDLKLMDPDKYAEIQDDAVGKLAGLPSVDADDFNELTDILGLKEAVCRRRPQLKLVI